MSENLSRKHPYAYKPTFKSGSAYVEPVEVQTARPAIVTIETEVQTFRNREQDPANEAILEDTELDFDQDESALKEGGGVPSEQAQSNSSDSQGQARFARQPTAKKSKVFANARTRKSRFTDVEDESPEEDEEKWTPVLSSNQKEGGDNDRTLSDNGLKLPEDKSKQASGSKQTSSHKLNDINLQFPEAVTKQPTRIQTFGKTAKPPVSRNGQTPAGIIGERLAKIGEAAFSSQSDSNQQQQDYSSTSRLKPDDSKPITENIDEEENRGDVPPTHKFTDSRQVNSQLRIIKNNIDATETARQRSSRQPSQGANQALKRSQEALRVLAEKRRQGGDSSSNEGGKGATLKPSKLVQHAPGGKTTFKGDDMYFSENSIRSPESNREKPPPPKVVTKKTPAPVVNQIFSQDDLENILESQKASVKKRLSSQLPRIPEQDEKSFRSRKRSSDQTRKSRRSNRSNLPPDKLQEELERQNEEIERMGKSIWLTDLFVDRPCVVILTGLAFIFIFTVLAGVFETYIPSQVTNRDFLDFQDENTLLFDAREAAFTSIQESSSETGEIPLQSRTKLDWYLNIGIECLEDEYGNECDNVLTPTGIKILNEIDQLVRSDPQWEQMCLFDSETNQTCADDPMAGKTSFASPLSVFKIGFGDDYDFNEITQFAIDFALFGLARDENLFNISVPLFSKDFTRISRKAKLVRVLVIPGGPIDHDGTRFKNMGDRWSEQDYLISDWEVHIDDLMMNLQKSYPNYRLYSFGRAYAYRYFYRQLIYDIYWALAAALLVYLFITYQTGSIFVSTTSMWMILFSFPITLVIYKLIMGITNVSALHLMVVFVVLGISADNIFVTWDAWCQSDTYPQLQGNYKKRMAYTFRRSATALLATSSTTAFAFMANGFSSLMPVSAFGWFAFVIIPVNYILIVLYYPAYLIVYETWARQVEKRVLEKLSCLCCVRCRNRDIQALLLQFFLDRFEYDHDASQFDYSEGAPPGDNEIQMFGIVKEEERSPTKIPAASDSPKKTGGPQSIRSSKTILKFSRRRPQMINDCKSERVVRFSGDFEAEGGGDFEAEGGSVDTSSLCSPRQSSAGHRGIFERVFGLSRKEREQFRESSQSSQSEKRDITMEQSVDFGNPYEAAAPVQKRVEPRNSDFGLSNISKGHSEAFVSNKISIPSGNRQVSRSFLTSSKSWKESQIEQMGRIELFFDTQFTEFIFKAKYFILMIGVLMTVYSGYRALEIVPLNEFEKFFKDDHIIMQSFDKVITAYNEGDQGQSIVVDVMWGVDNINKTEVDQFNASDIGTIIWDRSFDFSSPAAQLDVFDLCQHLKKNDDILYQPESIECWVEDFRQWLENTKRLQYPASVLYDYRKSEEGLTQKQYMDELVSEFSQTEIGREHVLNGNIGMIDGQLTFMKFTAKSAGGLYDPYELKNPFKEAWDKELNDFNSRATPGVNRSKQTAGLDWCFMIMEKKFVETMNQGLSIAIFFAFIALLVATSNLIIAMMACLSIGMIIVNVLILLPLNGWQLGSSESVGVVICVGFSVDYVVHLAAHYVHSRHLVKEERIRESLREMGISILSGSISTMLATVVLFICVVTSFTKFAAFVLSTVGLSLFFSLCFFASLCAAWGPEGETGNFNYMWKFTKKWCRHKKRLFIKNSQRQMANERKQERMSTEKQLRKNTDFNRNLGKQTKK